MPTEDVETNYHAPFITFSAMLKERALPYRDGVAINLCPRCFVTIEHMHVYTHDETRRINALVKESMLFMGFMCYMVPDEIRCFIHLYDGKGA